MNLVVDILTSTFSKNPGVKWLLRHKGLKTSEIRSLAQYAFIKSLLRDGVYIASNEKGVALCYKFNEKRWSFLELYYQIKFGLTSIKFSRLPKVLKREGFRKKMRPKSGNYLYFWFLGVLPEGENVGLELKNAVFETAKEYNLPVYLETSVERNRIIYERVGFSTFHCWEDKKEDIIFWFLKWDPLTS